MGSNEHLSQAGHRERLRQRFFRAGLGAFHDYEIVEMLLSLATPRRDMKEPAKEAIRRFGSLAGVLEAPVESLLDIKGIGPTNVFALKLPHAVARRFLEEKALNTDVLNAPAAVYRYLTHALRSRENEAFLVLFLNGRNQVLRMETLFEGTLTNSVVYPREVVKKVIQHKAAGVILVHNHPSGNPQPSPQDFQVTRLLRRALEPLEVKILDHIIIAGNGYYSFADHNKL